MSAMTRDPVVRTETPLNEAIEFWQSDASMVLPAVVDTASRWWALSTV